MIIVIEGIDGSGKSTVTKLLKDKLTKLGEMVVLFNEPGGTEMAWEIRSTLLKDRVEEVSPTTEMLLYFAGRVQNMTNIINKCSPQTFLIIDRFVHSTEAYQVYGRQLNRSLYNSLYSEIIGDFKPDLAFFIDIDEATADSRVDKARVKDRLEKEGPDFFKRCNDGFRTIAETSDWGYITLDGTSTPDDIVTSMLGHILEIK